VPLAAKAGGPFYGTENIEHVYSGDYPLSRYLYVYVNRAPNKPLDPLVAEFVKYILSRDGQEVVVKDGYLPLKSAVDGEEQAKLQ
jgi:phosphate transport system substrate-binding protein